MKWAKRAFPQKYNESPNENSKKGYRKLNENKLLNLKNIKKS